MNLGDKYTDNDLVMMALERSRANKVGPAERWIAVMDTFGFNSGFAVELCRLYNLDPFEIMPGRTCK